MPKTQIPSPATSGPSPAAFPGGKAAALIKRLKLLPHPEGGYFREIHRSRETVETAKGPRSALTTIYFLLPKGQMSVFHRVLSDEVWHYYGGAPLKLWRVSADFRTREAILLGPADAEPALSKPSKTTKAPQSTKSAKVGRFVQAAVIPAKDWQAAESLGDYTLVGCSVGPGFDFADFRMMRDDAAASRRLAKAFPALRKRI